jgi:hypothetical protein
MLILMFRINITQLLRKQKSVHKILAGRSRPKQLGIDRDRFFLDIDRSRQRPNCNPSVLRFGTKLTKTMDFVCRDQKPRCREKYQ